MVDRHAIPGGETLRRTRDAYYDQNFNPNNRYWTFATRANSAPEKATLNADGDISNPGENWFCDQDTLNVTLAGYDLESDSFARLKLQYRTGDAT